jgi:tetratricopeptide (TPR) repeat protein
MRKFYWLLGLLVIEGCLVEASWASSVDFLVGKDGVEIFMKIETNITGKTVELNASARNDSGQPIQSSRFCIAAKGREKGCDFELWTNTVWNPGQVLTWNTLKGPFRPGIETVRVRVTELEMDFSGTVPQPLPSPLSTPQLADRGVVSGRGTAIDSSTQSKEVASAENLDNVQGRQEVSGSVPSALGRREAAETSRTDYEQNFAKARAADAETRANPLVRHARELAADAQANYDFNDFDRAGIEFRAAADIMLQALNSATANARAEAEAAHSDLNSVKQLAVQDAQAASEETRGIQLQKDGRFGEAVAAYRRAASLYRDRVQPREDDRQKTAQRDELERQAVRAALERYRIAYESKDLNQIRAVFPSIKGVEESTTRNNFTLSKALEMKLYVVDIRISNDTATAAVRTQLTIKTGDNQTVRGQSAMLLSLRKGNGSWFIESVARQQ